MRIDPSAKSSNLPAHPWPTRIRADLHTPILEGAHSGGVLLLHWNCIGAASAHSARFRSDGLHGQVGSQTAIASIWQAHVVTLGARSRCGEFRCESFRSKICAGRSGAMRWLNIPWEARWRCVKVALLQGFHASQAPSFCPLLLPCSAPRVRAVLSCDACILAMDSQPQARRQGSYPIQTPEYHPHSNPIPTKTEEELLPLPRTVRALKDSSKSTGHERTVVICLDGKHIPRDIALTRLAQSCTPRTLTISE
jgi:hypothetical protein